MKRNYLNIWRLITLTAIVAAGSLHAAGTIKPYTNRAAFAADDIVDWGGLTALAGGDKCVSLNGTFSNLVSGLAKVTISGNMATGGIRRCNEGISYFGNFTGGDHLVTTDTNKIGPFTINFTSGPVYGAGLQIDSQTLGAFSGQIKAFDGAGNLLGTVIVNGTATTVLPADNTAPFMGIRSSAKEITKLVIDIAGIPFAVNKLDVALSASPILNSSFFVSQLYHDILNRAPTSTELTNGVNFLTANPTGLPTLAYQIYTLPEFHDNANYLTKCYLALLQRDPDLASWTQILKLMQSGTQQLTTLIGFLGTPEYQAAYPNTLTNTDFVTRLYTNLLKRAPDAGGLNYWTFLLGLGLPRAYVLNGFIASPEYDSLVKHRVDANLMYFTFLQRTGEPTGVNFWTVVMNFGVTLQTVVADFINSPEYLGRF